MSGPVLFWALIFGATGLGYFIYGRKQKKMVPLVCGLGLMFFPYFVAEPVFLAATGFVLLLVPYFVRR
jgi:hypothetical protein